MPATAPRASGSCCATCIIFSSRPASRGPISALRGAGCRCYGLGVVIARCFIVLIAVLWLSPAADAQQRIEPVHYFSLIACLPVTPKDYTGSKPVGAKVTTGHALVTEASRQFSKKDRPKKVIRVKITDGAYHRDLYGEFKRTEDFNREWADGYFAGYKIGRHPVHERYSTHKREGSIRGVVEGRFIIDITGYDVGPAEVVEWWRMVDLDRLAAMH